MEKQVLAKKNLYKWAKHEFATYSVSGKESLQNGNTLTLQ